MNNKDSQLIKRLLAYAKPYKWWFVFVFICMFITTGTDLAQPVLIGNAVDLFTEGYKIPLIEKDQGKTIEFEGRKLSHLTSRKESSHVSQILQYGDTYYWFETIQTGDAITVLEMAPTVFNQNVEKVGDYLRVVVEDRQYEGRSLTKEELKILRQLNMQPLIEIAVNFIVLLIASFIFTYVQVIVLQYIGQKIIFKIRQEVYHKMLHLPFRYYHENPIGKLVTRVTNDTETLNEMYTSVLVNLIKQVLFMVGVLVMMFTTHGKTAFYVLTVMPVVVIATMIFKYFSRCAYREIRNKLTEMNSFLSEHLSGMRVTQLFTREEAKVRQMKHINQELYRAGMKELIAFMLFRPAIFLLSYIAIAIVLLVGGNSVLIGTMSIGTLVVMVAYTKDLFKPIEQLAEQFNILQSALASSEKIFTVLDEDNEMEDGTYTLDEKKFKGSIEFKNVWFAYQGEEWVLKDVSFTINPGEKVAFVGATGAGKTSILSLICRYYDIQKGEILIDGIPIKQYKMSALRQHIGQVLQEVFMFTGDIQTNIRLGNEGISLEKVEEAAKLVNAHEFISKLEKGYEEPVLERGASLSTGQRQLISFARAVAYDPKVFILDEATANIDTETEGLIQDALYKIMDGRTTLMVAHRLSTIQHADNIIVLHKGSVREMGDHQSLLANKGIYHNLYELALKSQVMA